MKAKKSLGQNFLIDQSIVSRIVKAVSPHKDELILEIGPGHGALTQELIKQAGWVIAVELDEELATKLQTNFSEQNLTVVLADILKVDISNLIKEQLAAHPELKNKIRVVANLPYYISTAILSKLLELREIIQDMTLMLQKEVAERIASPAGGKEYGVLSVIAQLYCQTKILFPVKAGSFRPIPKVESAILQLSVYRELKVNVPDDLLIKVVYAAFSQRRKTILNSLKSSASKIDSKLLSEQIPEMLRLSNIVSERRAETINCQEFVQLTTIIYQYLK